MRAAAILLVLAAGACGTHHDRQPGAETRGAAEAAPAYSIQLRLDRKPLRTLTAADVGDGVALASLLPPAVRDPSTWYSLHARAGERALTLDHYAEQYADLEARVEPGPHGPQLALYQRPPPRPPAGGTRALKTPRQLLTGVALIKISTHPPPPETAQTAWAFDLVAGGDTKRVTTDDLTALRQTDAAMPAGKRGRPRDRQRDRRRGWRLGDVIALAAPVARVTAVTVVGDGDTAALSAAELADPSVEPLLATNRHGAVGLRVFRGGAEKQRVRRITRIDVTLRSAP